MTYQIPESARVALLQNLGEGIRLLSAASAVLNNLTPVDAPEVPDDGPQETPPFDPRDDTTKAFRLVNGVVRGVQLTVHRSNARFQCIRATWENTSTTNNVLTTQIHVIDRNNIPLPNPVVLATGYHGKPNEFDNLLLPGNGNYPVQHPIVNGFDAASGKQGYLAVYVCAPDNRTTVLSDIVGGLGLPNNQHGIFHIIFKEQ